MSKIKSPIEKKRLGYERDHFSPSEYPKAFRKNWPLKKAKANRSYRHSVKSELTKAGEDADVKGFRRESLRKWSVETLRERVEYTLARRGRRHSSAYPEPKQRLRKITETYH